MMVVKPMPYSIDTKEKAISLRKQGYSIKEVAALLNIAQSTSSLWLREIILSPQAQDRLRDRKILGQYKAIETHRKKRLSVINGFHKIALDELSKVKFNKAIYKLLCALFFWTEGGRSTDSYVYFINSDPVMVKTFVKLLHLSFPIEERKLRAMVQIHEYHNDVDTKKFWSEITQIPVGQFSKSYLKPHTGKRIRDGYQGSIRIRYYDYKIALELRAFYNVLAQII